jgi:hypothetical protein
MIVLFINASFEKNIRHRAYDQRRLPVYCARNRPIFLTLVTHSGIKRKYSFLSSMKKKPASLTEKAGFSCRP